MRRWTIRRMLACAAAVERDRDGPESFRTLLDTEIRAMVRRRMAESSPFPTLAEVPVELRELLSATSAREVKRLVRTVTVSGDGLAALVFNAHHLGYAHERFGFEKRPAQNQLSDEERRAFFFERQEKPELAARAFGKIGRMFDERCVYTAHVFANRSSWHVLSFTYDDAQLGRRGHWKHGAHIHYLSSVLDPRRTLQEVLDDLQRPDGEVHGEHLRFSYERNERSASDDAC